MLVLPCVISRTVSSKLEKNLMGAVELNISALPPLQADLARVVDFLTAALVFDFELELVFVTGFCVIMALIVALTSF